ncbi:MAG: hypothetical protein CO129_07535 [Ignavibacteriales bacterium CG_4_9_14_3_um_filter_34_10]|nr:MAG: hypothetical protein CO129_07535 [Ignavibacteriales bacterium CG_4_9_14_3_um_filter_34_10]
MKEKFLNSKLKRFAAYFLAFFIFVFFLNRLFLPWLVSSDPIIVPNVVGMDKEDAKNLLSSNGLNPIEIGQRFDNKIPINHVLFQRPHFGSQVKSNRRVYIYISGGEEQVSMPRLIGRSAREARILLDRLGLKISSIEEIESDENSGIIIAQQFSEGTKLYKNDYVFLKVSIGPQSGKVKVPNLISKSLKEGEIILRSYNLYLGRRTYITSTSLLTNTIIDQYPSPDNLVAIGDSIDVIISKSK